MIQQQKAYLRRSFGFEHIFLFGSFATGRASTTSDIDVLVEVPRHAKTYQNYRGAKAFLKQLLNRNIDLVYADSLNPVVRKEIQSEIIEIE